MRATVQALSVNLYVVRFASATVHIERQADGTFNGPLQKYALTAINKAIAASPLSVEWQAWI